MLLNIALSIFFVYSEDILEHIGVQNDHIAKEQYYDNYLDSRGDVSLIPIAITTPFIFANCLRILTSVLGLGPIGGYMLWLYVLGVYYARYRLYNIQYNIHTYVLYNVVIFLLAFVSWVPGDMIYNIQWSLMYFIGLYVFRIISGVIMATPFFITIHPIHHILWDPLLSFEYFDKTMKTGRDVYDWMLETIHPYES
jgi:hypothetical protein